MDELERRLRDAMRRAAEPPPPGLMESIRARHRRHRRRAGAGWTAAAVAVAFAIVPMTYQLSAGHSLLSGPPQAHVRSSPVAWPPPSAESGTVRLTCESANWGQLSADWRGESLRVGPLWFAYARQQGYVHVAGSTSVSHSRGRQPVSLGVMILEVADGFTVTMKPSPQSSSHLQFFDGFHSGGGNKLPAGDTGLTLTACPRTSGPGPNGRVTDFYLGFSLRIGEAAAAAIWTPASRHPTRVIFTCPVRGCRT